MQDVTRKVLLKSLHNDPHTTWVKGPSGKHTNVSALLDWPDDDDDDSDSNENSADSEPFTAPHDSSVPVTAPHRNSVTAALDHSDTVVSRQSRADSADRELPASASDDSNSSSSTCVGKCMMSKQSKQIITHLYMYTVIMF